MYDEDASPDASASLVDGWEPEDVRLLDELAHLGMDVARALTRSVQRHEEACELGLAEPLDPVQAARIAFDFSRIARSVRVTLNLKAQARGAAGPAPASGRASSGRSGRKAAPGAEDEAPVYAEVSPYPVGPDTPAVDDLPARRAFVADQIRLALDHALTWPGLDPLETEHLRDAIEAGIEREARRRVFVNVTPTSLVERIIRGLGLSDRWRAGFGDDNVFVRWILARPDDGDDPMVLPSGDAETAAFRNRWPRSGTSPPPPDTG